MKTVSAIGKWATRDHNVTKDVACKGTALESTAFKLGGKTFLFLQQKDGAYIARLKLNRSLAEAKRLGHEVGANGWVKITIAAIDPPAILEPWIEESRVAVAGAATPPTRSERKKSAGTRATGSTKRIRSSKA